MAGKRRFGQSPATHQRRAPEAECGTVGRLRRPGLTKDGSSYSPVRATRSRFANDVFVLNRHTGEARRITDVPAERRSLRISGSHLVWQDNCHELGEHYDTLRHLRLRFDQRAGIPLGDCPGCPIGDPQFTAIPWCGPTTEIVHSEPPPRVAAATAPTTGSTSTPTTSLPVRNGRESNRATTTALRQSTGKWWSGGKFETRPSPTSSFWTLGPDCNKSSEAGGRGSSVPLVSDAYVVWTVQEPCDVFQHPPGETQAGVFAYRLETARYASCPTTWSRWHCCTEMWRSSPNFASDQPTIRGFLD